MIKETNYDKVFQSQEHFRLIMDSMANPGKLNRLKADIHGISPLNNASILIGFALMNSDVTFFIQDHDEDITDYFIDNTSAKPASAEKADFLYLSGKKANIGAVEIAKEGSLEYPEKGAFLVLEAERISEQILEGSVELVLKGPGVNGSKKVFVLGVSPELLQIVSLKNKEYPLGVDTLLTDEEGQLLCLPRSNQFFMPNNLIKI
ncbi:MAG: phosphonate C-P lyase system protein PhnH [Cytophagales bacterium]|nr:phosphonate C-P lyase system protein PhnH [Cytophagales bacterium]